MTGNSAFGKLSHVLAFPFRGERWLTNLLIAALLCFASSIVPLVPIIFLLGYLARIARDILESSGEELELPEWNDWGRLFTDGLNLLGGTIIFWLPIAAVYLFSAFIWIIPAMFADGSGMNGPGTGFAIFMILSTLTQILISFVTVAFSLFIGITQPAFLTHLIAEKRFSAIFQFKAWWRIFRHNFTDFLLIFLLMIGLSYVYTMILFFLFFSIILCCLTPFFMAVGQAYLSVVYAAMVAYAYRFGAQKASLAQPAQPETASPAPADDAPTPAPDTTEEPPAVDEPPAEEAPLTAPEPDDLKKIEGIGPKTATVLNEVGIFTFAQLAEMDGAALREVLEQAGYARLARRPETWGEQASLAARGDWDALQELQDSI